MNKLFVGLLRPDRGEVTRIDAQGRQQRLSREVRRGGREGRGGKEERA
ncbi:MAG: hypothetical protein ABIP65_06395 [Vicinamibacterales bacterium]